MIYEYECRYCGRVLELQRPVQERDQPVYHSTERGDSVFCHIEPMTRVLSATPGRVVNPAAGEKA